MTHKDIDVIRNVLYHEMNKAQAVCLHLQFQLSQLPQNRIQQTTPEEVEIACEHADHLKKAFKAYIDHFLYDR